MLLAFPKATLKITFLFVALAMVPAWAADQDWQNWSLINVHHNFDSPWSTSMQVENRIADNISQFSELILKPGGYYQFNDTFHVGFGYKYEKKHNNANEQDLWEEIYYTPESNDNLFWTHQVRLEQRDIKNITGKIPRLRYLIHLKYPLNSEHSQYLVASEAVRFNLDDKGEGPVEGFEQNRLYFGMGFAISDRLNLETGYLWRYERQRVGENLSDHVIRVQFLFQTDGRQPFFAGSGN